jgi:hypothetical protein
VSEESFFARFAFARKRLRSAATSLRNFATSVICLFCDFIKRTKQLPPNFSVQSVSIAENSRLHFTSCSEPANLFGFLYQLPALLSRQQSRLPQRFAKLFAHPTANDSSIIYFLSN